jgi:hypothetical protein
VSSPLARRPDGSGIELDTVALVFLAVALGRSRRPPAHWRRSSARAATRGSGSAAFPVRRCVAALAVRAATLPRRARRDPSGLGGGPLHLLALLAGELWPVWLAALTLTPLLALAIVLRRPRDLAGLAGEPSSSRWERRTAAMAAPAAPPTSESGLFLGYRLAGEALLPVRRGRAYLPLPRLAHHLLVAGATGSGKTETVLRIADSLAHANEWAIVYVDGKGDRETRTDSRHACKRPVVASGCFRRSAMTAGAAKLRPRSGCG